MIYSLRPIAVNEEITYDYKFPLEQVRARLCLMFEIPRELGLVRDNKSFCRRRKYRVTAALSSVVAH